MHLDAIYFLHLKIQLFVENLAHLVYLVGCLWQILTTMLAALPALPALIQELNRGLHRGREFSGGDVTRSVVSKVECGKKILNQNVFLKTTE